MNKNRTFGSKKSVYRTGTIGDNKQTSAVPVKEDTTGKNFMQKILIWNKYRREIKRQRKHKPMTFQETLISWTKTLVGAILIVMIINGLAIASFVVPTGSMENTVMTGDFLFVNKFIYGPSSPQVIPFFNIPLPYFRLPGVRQPERGDVIVFIYPGDRDEIKPSKFEYYLKRCIATAGDTLLVKNKQVFVNNQEMPLAPNGKFLFPINNQPATFPYGMNWTADNYGPLRIPKKGDVIELNHKDYYQWNVFIEREGHTTAVNAGGVLIDGKPASTYTVERDYCFGMGDNRDNSLDSRFWGFIPVENVVGTPLVVYWSWSTDTPLFELGKKISSIRWSRVGTIIR
jgi:signal peptidase I